jgi:K+-sensing histidine kinase KdpD
MGLNPALQRQSLMMKETTPNPEYHTWNKKDQYLLSVITGSLSEKILATVYGLNTSQQAWIALATKFASKSKSRISNLKKQLQSLTQGPRSCADYLQSTKHLADQLSAVGNSIPKEEIITSILHGLNSSFTHFITTYSFHTRANEISFEDFQDELLSHELMFNQQQQQATDLILSSTETMIEAVIKTHLKATIQETQCRTINRETTPFPGRITIKPPCSMTIYSLVAQEHLARYVVELIILLLIAFIIWIMLFREEIHLHNWQPW